MEEFIKKTLFKKKKLTCQEGRDEEDHDTPHMSPLQIEVNLLELPNSDPYED